MLALATAPVLGAFAFQAPPAAPTRILSRDMLLDKLPSRGPAAISPALQTLIADLERLGSVPATPEFHSLSLAGHWQLRAVGSDGGAAEAPELTPLTGDACVSVADAAQCFSDEGVMRSTARFNCAGAVGELQVACTFTVLNGDSALLTTDGTGCRLSLPRVPGGVAVPDLVDHVLAGLSAEFRLLEAGSRLGLGTTYVDEKLRIARYGGTATRQGIAVYVRTGPGET